MVIVVDGVTFGVLFWTPSSTAIIVLDALWILNPKINDDVPIRNDTAVRMLLVRPGTIVSGAPVLVFFHLLCFYDVIIVYWQKSRDVNRTVSVSKEKNSDVVI